MEEQDYEYRQACIFAAIDARILEIWTAIADGSPLGEAVDDDDAHAMLVACLRAAYGKGYTDALKEIDGGRRPVLPSVIGYREGGA